MLKLSYGDRRPIYEQIKEKIKSLIISGVLKENERIPSVRELAVSMAINPNTIQKAYKELEGEGWYIYSLRSKGYFVAPVDTVQVSGKIDSLTESLRANVRELYFLGVEKEKIDNTVREIYGGANQ